MPLDVDAKAREQLSSKHRANVLAAIHFGAKPVPRRAATWLETSIPNRPLSPDCAEEVLPAAGAVSRFDVEGAQAAADDRSIFAAIETEVGPVFGIEAVTFDLYRRLLSGVTRAGFPHVLRIWNYVPRIHDTASGLERYMLFCKGRSEAFAAHYGAAFPDRLPAASAVGCPGDALVVHVLSAREPGRHVENPRQLAAYRYPERYGPKSPSFARGTVAGAAWDGAVFVSGTASIVGHESVFHGVPERQAEETMRNVCAVLDRAGVPGRGGPLGDRLKSLRVYVRFPDQADAIRAAILRSTGTAVPTAWLQAEICREELLVEIEATARIGSPQLMMTPIDT
jgi:chorismate lyase/3-hydroxybenzoate synthase